MKKTLLAFLCMSLAQFCLAQMQLNPVPQEWWQNNLAKEYFLADDIILLRATLIADHSGVNTFQNGFSAIGLEAGISICTGNVSKVLQHPDSLMSDDLFDWDLTDEIYEQTGLTPAEDLQFFELYFMPVGDSISFEFVLASEHYEGLECTEKADDLVIHLISFDPEGNASFLNLSHVPGKPDVPLNSNTVNKGNNLEEDTECVLLDPDWKQNSSYYQGSHPGIAFNGFTKVITTVPAPVVPYRPYQLVISLSDGDNSSFDSAVFLSKGSFTSHRDVPVRYEINDTTIHFCDTLQYENLTITESRDIIVPLNPPFSPVDSFLWIWANKTEKRTNRYYEICPGDTLNIAGQTIYEPQILEEHGLTTEGCDSTTIHRVSFARFSVDSIYQYHHLCSGDTLFLADTFFTYTTKYRARTNQGRCDTTIFHDINFVQHPERVERILACFGDTVHLLGQTITDDTMLVDTIPTGDFCDSLVYCHVVFSGLEFSVNPLLYCTDDTMLLKYGIEFLAIDTTRMDSIHFSTPIPIQTVERGIAESVLNINSFNNASSVSELEGVAEICVNLEHSSFNQLDLQVTAPNGKEVFLNRHAFITSEYSLGEPIDNDSNLLVPGKGYQYCWTMSALNTMIGHAYLYSDSPLPAGRYLPEGSFYEFNSSPANGQWRLTASSFYESYNGHLFDWSIRFTRPPVDRITRQGWSLIDDDLGVVRDSLCLYGDLPAGGYEFGYFLETQDRCFVDTVLSVLIADQPPLPEAIDTFLCAPAYMFGQWIDSSGVYGFEFAPPEYCESINTSIKVQMWDSIQADFTVNGEQNLYHFLVETSGNEEVLIDLGNGEVRQQKEISYTYSSGGSFQPTATVYTPCDTLVLLSPELNVPPSFEATGKVETGLWTGEVEGIANVLLLAESVFFPFPSTSTSGGGFFQHEDLWKFASFRLRPSKNDDPLNGLDIADLIRLSRHLNGSYLFSYPEQTLAADLDCDAMITNQDILELRSFLLEPGKEFPDSCASWMFWPQNYPLEDVSSPFDHPVDISIDSIQADTAGLNFYGVKRGDIGGNATAARGGAPPDSLFLRLKNGYVPKGEQVRLDFRVENFDELVGFQAELRYDTTALDFEGLMLGEVPGLAEEHFGLSKVQEGIIRVVWLDILGNNYSLADGTLAFGLHFVAKQEIIDRSEHIAIDFREFNAASFNAELVEGPVALKIDFLTGLRESDQQPFRLLQNQPNPFSKTTIIPFYLPKACQASLTILNLAGQVVLQEEGQYGAGDHREEIHLDAPGIYYYVLTTPWGRLSKRMVLTR